MARRKGDRFRMPAEDKAKILHLRSCLLTGKEIAAQTGWSEAGVWKVLRYRRHTASDWGQYLVYRGAGL